VALLGGLAVLVAEAGGDLLPGGACGAGDDDELVLTEVEFAAFGGDGVEIGKLASLGYEVTLTRPPGTRRTRRTPQAV
jgi:hypothetical protein